MGAIRRWSEQRLIDTIARAAAAGHDCNDLHNTKAGTVCVCTCGWQSTPRRQVAAAVAGLWHASEVCAALDERKRLDLVEWSDAPDSKTLRHLLRQPQDATSEQQHFAS